MRNKFLAEGLKEDLCISEKAI